MRLSNASYGEFSLALHNRLGDQRTPMEVSIEITRRCPLACQHCYNNLPMADLAARKRELTKEEYFFLLDELADMGVLWLLFTGGEIFARKDFLAIYTYAKQKGFLITLFTNGILVNQQIADYLNEYPPFGIEITLYGRTRETYERLTAMPGSYDRCMRGIRLLLDRGLPLKLKTVGTSINKHEVREMRRFAEEELAIEFKFDSLISPRIDCSAAPLGVRLSPEEVVAMDLDWNKLADAHRKSLQRELAASPGVSETVYGCGGGVKSFAIDPYGHMSICVLSHQETYDIRQGSVLAGWEKFLLEVRERKRTRPSKCVACKLHSVCSMCPANAELENGDPESPVEFLCEVAHLRAKVLGFDVPEHGDCELCTPVGRASLQQKAERLRAGAVDLTAQSVDLLPVLNNSNGVQVGCGGCAAGN
ncbi:MAG TPA: radical SAM protein [Terriglobales bacterium]|jgi:radical SAM protein with 4Fe4S-binding SPASM domain|nr:radical SAM protein [Terriglobales bacterium]